MHELLIRQTENGYFTVRERDTDSYTDKTYAFFSVWELNQFITNYYAVKAAPKDEVPF